jgi:hypothetical protein
MKTFHLFVLGALSAVCLSNRFVGAQEAEATATAVRVPAASVVKSNPLTVTVELVGAQKITGTLFEITELPFRGSIGAVKIQLSEVAGIKLATSDDPSTTVIFKNGDSITGATENQTISVDTEWGSAKINGTSIVSMTFLPDLKWTSSMQSNGKRWSLVDVKSQPGQSGPGMTLPSGSSVTNPAIGLPTSQPGTRVVPSNSTTTRIVPN